MQALSGSYVAPVSPDNPGDLAYFRAHTDDILSISSQPSNTTALRVAVYSDRAAVVEARADATVELSRLYASSASVATGSSTGTSNATATSPFNALTNALSSAFTTERARAIEVGYFSGPAPLPSRNGTTNTGTAINSGSSGVVFDSCSPITPSNSSHDSAGAAVYGAHTEPASLECYSVMTQRRPHRQRAAVVVKASTDADGVSDVELEARVTPWLTVRGFAVTSQPPALLPSALTLTPSRQCAVMSKSVGDSNSNPVNPRSGLDGNTAAINANGNDNAGNANNAAAKDASKSASAMPFSAPEIWGAEARYDCKQSSVGVKYCSDGSLWGVMAAKRFHLTNDSQNATAGCDSQSSSSRSQSATVSSVTVGGVGRGAVTLDTGIEYLISPKSGDDSFSLAAVATVPQHKGDAAAAAVAGAVRTVLGWFAPTRSSSSPSLKSNTAASVD